MEYDPAFPTDDQESSELLQIPMPTYKGPISGPRNNLDIPLPIKSFKMSDIPLPPTSDDLETGDIAPEINDPLKLESNQSLKFKLNLKKVEADKTNPVFEPIRISNGFMKPKTNLAVGVLPLKNKLFEEPEKSKLVLPKLDAEDELQNKQNIFLTQPLDKPKENKNEGPEKESSDKKSSKSRRSRSPSPRERRRRSRSNSHKDRKRRSRSNKRTHNRRSRSRDRSRNRDKTSKSTKTSSRHESSHKTSHKSSSNGRDSLKT